MAIEPQAHRSSEGADIGKQAHMVKLFKTHQPVLSGSFRSVEGPQAVVIHHPVFSAERGFSGSVFALFAPEYLLSKIIGPVASNLTVDIFLMQPDGLLIFDDADEKQIGLNVFEHEFYKPFPEMFAFAGKVAAADEGAGVYRFVRKNSEVPETKAAFWKTATLHGSAWRLVIACPEDNIEE